MTDAEYAVYLLLEFELLAAVEAARHDVERLT